MAASALWVVMVGWWSLGNLVGVLHASAGDVDPLYRGCVEQCERTGQMGDLSLRHCRFLSDGVPGKISWYINKDQIYRHWNQWNCRSDCRYNCVKQSERHRAKLGLESVKYHGKWPHRKETLSTALPALNLIMHSHGWLSFLLRLHHKLPSRHLRERACYEYAGLWHIYALLSMNAWFWSTVCHSREFDLTEKMDYSSAVVLVGYSLILSILRAFNLRDEASRVMVAAPFLGFIMTHICYLNFCELDYGFNMKVCNVMGMAQLLLWCVWAGVTSHPSRFKLWAVGVGGGLAMLLEAYDFPPYRGYVDGHTLWHAAAIPSTYLWWSFVKDDAVFQTQALVRKAK